MPMVETSAHMLASISPWHEAGERLSLNWFIYQCLAGKIPFDEPRRARRDAPLYR